MHRGQTGTHDGNKFSIGSVLQTICVERVQTRHDPDKIAKQCPPSHAESVFALVEAPERTLLHRGGGVPATRQRQSPRDAQELTDFTVGACYGSRDRVMIAYHT
jgi:hypothetical protein